MSCSTYLHRFFVVNALTVYYSIVVLLMIAVKHVRGWFVTSTSKRKLEPPAALTDPKYGFHKYIKVNNTKLHYVESGDPSKPLMLYIHGFPEFWYSWRHQIVKFQKDYWCIAVDMRGYGDSERPEGVSAYRIEELVGDLRDLIKELGREKAIIVSHDWGGVVTAKFRDLHPEMVSCCILLGSMSQETWVNAIWSNPAQQKKSWYVFMFRLPVIGELLMQSDNLAVFEQSMMIPGKSGVTPEDIECFKYWFGKTLAFTPPINYYRANFAYVLPEKQVNGKVPMLVAHPALDPYIEGVTLELMKKEYDAETVVIENTGHFCQQEEPEKVNKLIEEFLTKHNL